jgi:hypothetical protein
MVIFQMADMGPSIMKGAAIPVSGEITHLARCQRKTSSKDKLETPATKISQIGDLIPKVRLTTRTQILYRLKRAQTYGK